MLENKLPLLQKKIATQNAKCSSNNRPPDKDVISETPDLEDNESENEETINEPTMEIDFIRKKSLQPTL